MTTLRVRIHLSENSRELKMHLHQRLTHCIYRSLAIRTSLGVALMKLLLGDNGSIVQSGWVINNLK